MKMIRQTLAAAMVLAATAAPGFAQAATDRQTPAEMDAFDTQVPALTYGIAENRMAASAYMADALKLLDMAEAHLRAGETQRATIALMAASGKLTYAHLDLNQDESFSDRIWPLSMSAEQAMRQASVDPQQALATVSAITPEVATLYRVQLAQLGGGAGMAGFEPLIEPREQ